MKVTGYIGEELFLEYRVYYRSEEAGLIEYVKEDKNVKINGNCIKFQNNKLIGAQKGQCSLVIFRDGRNATFWVDIKDSPKSFMAKNLKFLQ